jgi:UDP-3-O-[3-hydroxymyristoyl] glucosamine N-acyltransferase
MPTTLADLATLVGGRLSGVDSVNNVTVTISGATILDVAVAGELTLVDHADRAPLLQKSPAAAAIVPRDFPESDKPTIQVDDVHVAFAKAVIHFRPPRSRKRGEISPAAWISPTAHIGDDVEVYPGATIGDDVVLGDNVTIHPGVRILPGCVIGRDTTIFPNAVLYEETCIGERVIIHAGAVIGAYGFGYRQVDGAHQLAAQLGYVVIGDDAEIGACATVDRGTYGATTIGDGSKIDNLVQIGHNCRLGKHNLICGQVGIAGSTTTGDYVVMAGQAGVRDHVHIGDRAVLCSKAGISNNVGDGEVMLGQPATPLRRQKLQMAAIAKLPEMRRDFRKLQHQLVELQQKLGIETTVTPDEQAA